MDRDDKQSTIKTLLDLPTVLLVNIVSFLIVGRDKLRLQFVSRRLRSVIEIPSLWNEFAWPYYHINDEGRVKYVLKAYGQHVKRLSFPHHVTPAILTGMLSYCNNVVQLSLPSTKLDPEELGKILLQMGHLQRLDVEWDIDIKQLLMQISVNLKELTIRLKKTVSREEIIRSTDSWVRNWLLKRLIPQEVNIVSNVDFLRHNYKRAIRDCWVTLNSESPAGYTGRVKL